MSQAVFVALGVWRFSFWCATLIFGSAALYLRGFRQLHRQMPSRFPKQRLWFYLLGSAVWHLPGPFELALGSNWWHAAEHASFMLGGILFWYPVVRPWPALARWSSWALIPYLLLADAENSMLAAFLVFSGRLLYPSYASLPRMYGFSAVDDQIVAGAIMWVPGRFYF